MRLSLPYKEYKDKHLQVRELLLQINGLILHQNHLVYCAESHGRITVKMVHVHSNM